MSDIGITGSRKGMTHAQYLRLEEVLADNASPFGNTLRHGDCIGVDEEAHEVAKRLGYDVVIYPPTNPRLRAFCAGLLMPAKPYLERNKDIVLDCELLIAIPREGSKGTLQCYGYATKRGRSRLLITEDGKVIRS